MATAPAGSSKWTAPADTLLAVDGYYQHLADNWEKTQRLIKGKINAEE